MTRVTKRPGAQAGFTIIELMVVVTVIAILVAFAVPGLREAKKAGNESATISALRALSSSQEGYRSRYGGYGDISDLQSTGYIDETFAMPSRHGYVFADGGTGNFNWSTTADPNSTTSGDRHFFIDETNVIRASTSGTADGTDPAI